MHRASLILVCLFLVGSCTPRQTSTHGVQPQQYEQVEYLSGHLAIGICGGTAYLLTDDGEVVAYGEDAETLKVNAEAAYVRFIDEEYASWETILDQYDSLCNACLAKRPASELLGRLDSIEHSLQRTVGRMDAQQQTRFAAIHERYERYK